MDLVERARKRRDVDGAEEAVRAELAALLAARDAAHWEPSPAVEGGPAIVLVVGVNGTGKTTTIGKLAARERSNGRRVVLAAADTFRAAAIDQLRIWAQRTDSEIVAHAPNADPAAVVFDALDAAVARARGHRDRRHRRPAAHEVEPDGGAGQGPPGHRQAAPGRRGRDVLRPRRDHRPERPRPGQGLPRGGRA